MNCNFDVVFDRSVFSSTKWPYPQDPLYADNKPIPLWVVAYQH
ncbi:hypothetical protein Phpb_01464 [Photorhabdus namnaonensis]|uniref:Uncharacterized protein n=1 Tax=Photorhabdus namnaonensis TaxID=1851568 RepID=A0A1B8YK60_9GAMM|nr:hypothetical protein Phpb_01464 [Photorhabdus namnaonensis]